MIFGVHTTYQAALTCMFSKSVVNRCAHYVCGCGIIGALWYCSIYLCVFLKCVSLGCTLEHTQLSWHTLNILFGIIKYCHILHMYSIQDRLIASVEKNVFVNETLNFKFWEENEIVSRGHCTCERPSDGIHTVPFAVLSFYVGSCFSHCALPPTEHTHKNIGWWYGKVLGLILVWLVLFYINSCFVIAAWDFELKNVDGSNVPDTNESN